MRNMVIVNSNVHDKYRISHSAKILLLFDCGELDRILKSTQQIAYYTLFIVKSPDYNRHNPFET